MILVTHLGSISIAEGKTISITAEMEENYDSGLFGVLNEYEIIKFDMSITPELLCPSDPCVYELEE